MTRPTPDGGGYAPSDKRSGDWTLLGEDSDPLPADEYTVAHEAKHYSDTASMIHDQVTRLRKIANASQDGSLQGDYVDPLVKSASDLADHLDDTEGRFNTVATQLTRWAPVLAHGRTMSAKYLQDATDASSSANANKPPTVPADKTDHHAVAAEKKRATAYSDATGDLSTAKSNYDDLMHNGQPGHEAVRKVAGDVAKAIKDASDDSLKDSWWDKHVRKWIHDHAGLLKFIADVLTWIATAIVIAIVVFGTGGLALAAVLTAGALLIHTMLAANGDGSWTDVALDAFALLTMGGGKLLTEGARGLFALDEGMSTFSRVVGEARGAFSAADGLFGKAGAWLTKSNFVMRNLRGLYAGVTKFHTVINTEFEGGIVSRLLMGDKDAGGLYNAINSAIKARGPSFLLNSGRNLMNFGVKSVFRMGVGVDFTAKVINPAFPTGDGHYLKHGLPAINVGPIHIPDIPDWIEDHTVKHGGYW